MPATSNGSTRKPRARVGALAKLPVFFNLEGKRAILAGGSAAAAWKAELLAAAGANVEIYAAELEPDMAALLSRGAAAGTLTHRPRPWATDIFAGAAIALADAETEAEAQAFYCAAIAAGIPVNVIDKPAFCQFQFGSIVNRSPVIVSISTDGAAPILGQAIRRRIESLLPPALAEWGQLASAIRTAVTERLAPGPERRTFWENFSDRAFGSAPKSGDRQAAADLIDEISNRGGRAKGKLTVIAASSGDPELLTLKAVRALQAADVIIFDEAVASEVLELARREAKRIPAETPKDSAGATDPVTRDTIIQLAGEGRNVIRLTATGSHADAGIDDLMQRLEVQGIPVAIMH
ncbi:MAG: siroheme synthase [Alphaproteobacteria bacterium]|nr:siroheme synthase [Alphaproteobacteria bacterium]